MRLNFILLLSLLVLGTNVYSIEDKHALIIAIGDYPNNSGWGDINSINDIPLIENSLLSHGFKKANIQILKNEKATYSNIKLAFELFKSKLAEGDIAVIHYSGHGQLIYDTNDDEVDGYDEAWIPVDACAAYSKGYYEGENHLRDDELGDYIINIRNKLGKEGQLLMIMDSCHSGTATRGPIGDIHRGSIVPFQPEGYDPIAQMDENISFIERQEVDENAAAYVAISGATSSQLNYEYNGRGSLSYAFSEAMANLSKDYSYRQLFAKITAKMNIIAPAQQPTIEGNGIDLSLFKNEYKEQQGFFEITEFLGDKKLRIRGGKLHYLLENTTIYICKSGTIQPAEENIVSRGKIIDAKFNESVVAFEDSLLSSNVKDFWVFIDQLSYKDISIKVYLDSSIPDKDIKDSITSFLAKKNLGEIVNDSLEAEVGIMFNENGLYQLFHPGSLNAFEENNRDSSTLKTLKKGLFNYAQGKYLKNLNLTNKNYAFQFALLPVELYDESKMPKKILNENAFLNNKGAMSVRPGKDYVLLRVTNLGTEPIYFSIIEINSKGEVSAFMPNSTYRLTDNERLLLPGQSKTFSERAFGFGPPFEQLMLKGFSSNAPLDLSIVVTGNGIRGLTNPLEQFVKRSYVQTRGSETVPPNVKIDGYSSELIYEIVKRK